MRWGEGNGGQCMSKLPVNGVTTSQQHCSKLHSTSRPGFYESAKVVYENIFLI
jgi:hypothetical protein